MKSQPIPELANIIQFLTKFLAMLSYLDWNHGNETKLN